MNKEYIIGIDIGGTKIAGAISDRNGSLLYSTSVKTMAEENKENILIRIKAVIRDLMSHMGTEESQDIIGIGIGSPGTIDSKKGVIVESVNINSFIDIPIVSIIEDEFDIKAYLENDANAAALGELWFGAGKGSSNFIYITVSTGIGGGIVLNGNIYSGNTSNAGEIGHMTIDPKGPKCNCGNYGCLEVLSSGTAIARIANERTRKGEDTVLKEYNKITSLEVFEAAYSGDKLALSVINTSLNYLGIGVANIVNLLDPEKVIIGGGVSKAGALVFEKVRKVVKDRCFKTIAEKVVIVPAGLGVDSGIVGAVSIVLSKNRMSIG